MNIISVDLPWKENKRGHRAVAVADLAGNVRIKRADNREELLELVCDAAEPQSIVLLDIPIDGCENLGDKHFRPVSKALAHQGIWIRPNSTAKNNGGKLKKDIQDACRGRKISVQEIYPYAIYKFLAYLKDRKDRKLLGRLKLDRFEVLLDDSFRGFRPRKYKTEKNKDERLKNMEYLYSLLMDTGLNFRIPLHYPDASSNLGKLGDEYDACLGAMVGVYLAGNSSYACVAGDSSSGNILLLADRWLAGELGKEVKIDNLKKE